MCVWGGGGGGGEYSMSYSKFEKGGKVGITAGSTTSH